MIFLGILVSLAAIGTMCWLLFNLAALRLGELLLSDGQSHEAMGLAWHPNVVELFEHGLGAFRFSYSCPECRIVDAGVRKVVAASSASVTSPREPSRNRMVLRRRR